ncbi:MAG: glutamate mutase L [Peptococcaceae bacterium]|nr:glutamate mutase L [Peptococcaceae bacterium]
MDCHLLIDFGSTYTKVLAVDLETETVLGRAQSVTTVDSNIMIGLRNALDILFQEHPEMDESSISRKIASSSAAGGLRMIAIGLVRELTLEAARRAALGAGAKIVGSYAHELDEESLQEIEANPCDLIMLSGGTDGGNKEVILHNAQALAELKKDVTILVAGNRVVRSKIKQILQNAGKQVVVTENVMPEVNEINVEPARAAIRDIFMERIVKAKGLDGAQTYVGNIVMPTPMASLRAAQLLAEGTEDEAGLGDLLIVEIGGATTNIHSVGYGYPRDGHVVLKGLPEPLAKRTVEGDLGIRYNAHTIYDLAKQSLRDNLSALNYPLDLSTVEHITQEMGVNVGYVPDDDAAYLLDTALAKTAVQVAVERHAGILREVPGLEDLIPVQYGKDLTHIKVVIGTGGVFHYGRYPARILAGVLYEAHNPSSLKPKNPDFYVDQGYVLYGAGLLAGIHPTKALRILKKNLHQL